MPVVLTRSTTDSTRNCSTSMPPSWLIWRVAVEAGGDLLRRAVACGRRSPAIWSIDELVEGHVAVEGGDDPVAVLPDRPGGVDVVAVGVGVARLVEPEPAPSLAVMGRGQQAVDGRS